MPALLYAHHLTPICQSVVSCFEGIPVCTYLVSEQYGQAWTLHKGTADAASMCVVLKIA